MSVFDGGFECWQGIEYLSCKAGLEIASGSESDTTARRQSSILWWQAAIPQPQPSRPVARGLSALSARINSKFEGVFSAAAGASGASSWNGTGYQHVGLRQKGRFHWPQQAGEVPAHSGAEPIVKTVMPRLFCMGHVTPGYPRHRRRNPNCQIGEDTGSLTGSVRAPYGRHALSASCIEMRHLMTG